MSEARWLRRAGWIALLLIGGMAFFWVVVLRLIYQLGGRGPCPYSLAWTTDNALRRWYMRGLLDRVGLRAGERVLELGPGPGAFTVEAARRLGPEGHLMAVDIEPRMIAAVERKVRAAGLRNVETHTASAYELPLADGSLDRAFLITVLPELPDPQRALAELRRVLRSPAPADGEPGGLLSISEEFLDPAYPRVQTTIRWVERAGFELIERHGNWWCYTVNFRKRSPT